MPTIPPLVRDPPPDDAQSSTGRPVAARMVRTQRRYASNFNISFVYEPPKPISKPGLPPSGSTFSEWRAAAAELGLPGDGAGDPSNPAAHEGTISGVAAPPRHRLHDVLLGTTSVVLLCVLGGIGYAVWSGAVPGVVAPGGTAPKGSSLAAIVHPLADFAAKGVARVVPDHVPAPPSGKEAVSGSPSQLKAPLPPPSADPEPLALAAPLDEPAAAGPLPPASGSSTVAADAVPLPTPAAPDLNSPSNLREPVAAPPIPALPPSAAEADPAPEQAADVPPAKSPEPIATPPVIAEPDTAAAVVEPVAVPAVVPIPSVQAEAALAAPALAAATVRLPPAPEWLVAGAFTLDSVPEAAVLATVSPALLTVSAGSAPSAAEPAVPAADPAPAVSPGVDARKVVSTMELMQEMSLLVHDMHGENLRYRTEVTALTGAVQAKAVSLEERLKLAEARSVAGGDVGVPPVLRGYRVQAGSPGAAVLSDVSAGPERVARLLVMVGDQLPGAGRVTAIVQRGGAWIVRTERGVIQ